MSGRLNFDGPSYRPQRPPSGVDPGLKRMLGITGAIGAVLALVVGGWSLLGHSRQGVPVIEAPAGPVRVKPENPGGMQVAGVDETALPTGAEALAPPPEAPALPALQRQFATKAPHPAAAIPAPGPAAGPALGPARGPAPAARTVAPTIVPSPAPTTASVRVALPQAPAGVAVQLAAFDSAAAAQAEWARLRTRMPALLAERRAEVLPATSHGRAVFRLRTGGFADMAQAAVFCGKMRALGAECTIAAF